jgi:glycosyltransferase involved in cell wall biosynthesis
MDYVLITAAKNEEPYIEETIKSVLAQTVLPKRWVIVSDGSTDQTDQIVAKYATYNKFIEFTRREGKNHTDFASKVHALNLGYKALKDLTYDFIGHLDADVSFDKEYYEKILAKFRQNPALGLAGGLIFQQRNGRFQSRPFNSSKSVAGSIQLFRRNCYGAIGGFIPLEAGGEDWYAEVMARARGWTVEAFPELKVFHHKPSKAARGLLRDSIRQGIMDYSLGSHPLFEASKCICRIRERPFVVVAFMRLGGFLWCYWRRQKRQVPIQFIRYLRREQLERLKCTLFSFLE